MNADLSFSTKYAVDLDLAFRFQMQLTAQSTFSGLKKIKFVQNLERNEYFALYFVRYS